MTQLSIYDAPLARDARDEAIARVDRHADTGWKVHARRCVLYCANTYDDFTTDDVWRILTDWGIDPPHEPRALGAVMNALHRSGQIVRTDRTRNSNRVACHSRPTRVWLAA